jgi:effector-binding domain-containing protein
MSVTPEVIERAEQPYVAIRAEVTMQQLAGLGERLGEVFGWLAAHDIAPAGPPFFRYHVIDMDRELEVEAGVPVAAGISGDDRLVAGVLPAGRYVTAIHVGHPDGLVGAVAGLLDWAAGQGLQWDMQETADGERWGSRLEIYLTDPSEQPDMSTWETQLAFRLAG